MFEPVLEMQDELARGWARVEKSFVFAQPLLIHAFHLDPRACERKIICPHKAAEQVKLRHFEAGPEMVTVHRWKGNAVSTIRVCLFENAILEMGWGLYLLQRVHGMRTL